MNNNIAVIHQDPAAVLCTLHALGLDAVGLVEHHLHLIDHRLHLGRVVSVGDYKVIGDCGDLVDLDHADIKSLLVVQCCVRGLTCESAGDYASGTNHTLPTHGYATAYNGVNLDSYCRKITFQHLTEEGIRHIGHAVELMAEAEQLDAHKNAMSVRIRSISNE